MEYWLEDLDLEDRLSPSTRQLYERDMRTLVLPAFAELTLREIGVARCDRFIKQLAKQSYSRAKHARVVLRLALALAVRHEILPRNPMDHIARLHRTPSTPDALTVAEVDAVRHWESGLSRSGPRPDGQLGQIIEVMLGSSARIGEVLAIRRCDVDVAGSPPTLRIAGTIVTRCGEPAHRQDHPKTAKSRRIVALPSYAAEAVRQRLAVMGERSPEALLFCSRNGTPLTPNNVRRQLRRVMKLAEIDGVTPHAFRRTVATAVNALMLAKHAEDYRIEYNQTRPHEAIAWNRPQGVHLARPTPPRPPSTKINACRLRDARHPTTTTTMIHSLMIRCRCSIRTWVPRSRPSRNPRRRAASPTASGSLAPRRCRPAAAWDVPERCAARCAAGRRLNASTP
ncbi:tyrosine-type recombinase/integrase [Jiangella endophytica]|uniref:tyrosine-type recombinase/integrase n=1 Tax=Jiangella endophytica TaxID=1623398 RepID=UPI0018E50CA2